MAERRRNCSEKNILDGVDDNFSFFFSSSSSLSASFPPFSPYISSRSHSAKNTYGGCRLASAIIPETCWFSKANRLMASIAPALNARIRCEAGLLRKKARKSLLCFLSKSYSRGKQLRGSISTQTAHSVTPVSTTLSTFCCFSDKGGAMFCWCIVDDDDDDVAEEYFLSVFLRLDLLSFISLFLSSSSSSSSSSPPPWPWLLARDDTKSSIRMRR
mmetsp:Transcript_8373/g.13561  ORF Transcript_8373/g.13561 Transcript_8373/m.13561 type:complete len:215 (-) Transcript_8373:151-795(-)